MIPETDRFIVLKWQLNGTRSFLRN